MKKNFREALDDSPVIAAVKDEAGLMRCLSCESRIVFVLFGDICNIASIVERIKEAGKLAMVHIDLINGLAAKEIAVDFIRTYTKADGVISTRPALIRRARELEFVGILRLFVIDSMAYENLEKQMKLARPDVIEVLPALMPKVVSRICRISQTPVIAGGLVSEREDIMSLLQAGVISVSTTNQSLWFI